MHACSLYWGSDALECRTLRLQSQSSAGLRMQPYTRAPDLVWPGHLQGTGCLSARDMDTGFPTVVWRLRLGPGCAWVWVSVTPPALAGVFGGCVWVRFVVSPLFCRLGFAVFAVGLGFPPAPHLSWLGLWDVCGCVRSPPAPRRSRFWCAVWACVLGSGFWRCWEVLGCVCACVPVPRGLLHLLVGGAVRGCVGGPGLVPCPATPAWGVGACVGLCAPPACTPPFLAGVCGVGVCDSARVPAVTHPSWFGYWGVCAVVRVPRLPLPFRGGRLWRRGVRVLPLVGFAPPPLLWFWFCFLGGGVSCLGFVVSVAGCPGLGFRGLCPPIPSLAGCWGVWPPLAVFVGGLVALGRSRPPPLSFSFRGGSACSSFCPP